jgi:outer membrane protein assembly factor BamB
MLQRLGPGLFFLSAMLLGLAREQETEPPRQSGTRDPTEASEPLAPPAGPPAGILPIAEIARIELSPRERPRVLLQGEALVLVTESGSVELYQSESGELRWKLGLPGEALEIPVVLRSDPLELLLATKSGKLLFVDGATGRIRREVALGFEIALAPAVAGERTLYLGTPEGAVVAYDRESESERFRVETAERPNAFTLLGTTLVVSGATRTLTAIDAERGEIRWSLRARAGFSAPGAVSESGRLYVGDDAGDFYCLDVETGKTRFRWSTGAAIRAPALVDGKRVYVASYGNTLYAYDAGGGSEQWRANLPGRPATGPILVHRRLLVATFDGVLVEVSLDRGALSDRYVAPGELGSAPSFAVALPEAPDPDGPVSPEASAIPGPAPAPQWYERHRVALPLRTGAVLLLGHKPPEPAEGTETEAPKEKPPSRIGRASTGTPFASPGQLSFKQDASILVSRCGVEISIWNGSCTPSFDTTDGR